MSQNPTQNTDGSVPDGFIEVRSPYRPYPLGAKKALRNAVDSVTFPDDDNRCAYVSAVPPEDVIEDYELTVIRTDDPEEVWEDKSGTRIEIYSDRVEREGREMNINPDEAKAKAEQQDHFTRIHTGDSNE